MRGRKPTPHNLRVIAGNPGKRPLRPPVQINPSLPEPPDFLSPVALAEWHRLVAEFAASRLLTALDRGALGCYVTAYGDWATAEAKIREQGLLMRTTSGRITRSPWAEISHQSMELMLKFGELLGLSPVARTRLSAVPTPRKDNPFALIG
jgi:P27 family predicted phage terminase small subunit